MTLQNNSYVDALVTVSIGEDLDLEPAANFTWGEGFSEEGNTEANIYGKSIMEKFSGQTDFEEVLLAYDVITIELTDESGNPSSADYSEPINIDAYGGELVIYGDIKWTSINENNSQSGKTYENYGFDSWEEFSDAVDTILGMYYTGITFSVTWSAVQNSTQPI